MQISEKDLTQRFYSKVFSHGDFDLKLTKRKGKEAVERIPAENCQKCGKKLAPYKTIYYGVFSNLVELYDWELSFKTSYCEECAKSEARRTKENTPWFDTARATNRYMTFRDQMYLEVTEYSDGSTVQDDVHLIQTKKH